MLRASWIRSTAVLTGACSAALLSHPVASQPSTSVSGTLMCIIADVPGASGAAVDLSCNFKSRSGLTADYIGWGETRTGGIPLARHAFIWAVVAVDASRASLLDGTYVSGPSQQGAAVLVGGPDGSLRLKPVPNTGNVLGSSRITRLTLKAAEANP